MTCDEHWREQAACRGHDPEMWFDTARLAAAVRICQDCPVATDCHALALRLQPQHGVWAGHLHEKTRPSRMKTLRKAWK